MSRKPPVRPGITFEIGSRIEAQDYLQKWYPSKIEKMDYEEGKMLVHFERWSSRYDEWIHWDSTRVRPLERPALRKEGLKDEEENCDFQEGEEVLARWTDCRYYPAKIETINKEGSYTVQFYDGVIRCLKKMHIKSMPEDAKGQDWIALVKAAAAAAAKNKPINKPRTSVNSSKDKEERTVHKTPVKKEEMLVGESQDLLLKEEQPTSSQNLGLLTKNPLHLLNPEMALEEVPKQSPQHREDDLLLKRKTTQNSSFQAKRARLNQITGLLASKAVGLDSADKKLPVSEKPPRPEEAGSPKPQTQKQADMCRSGITVTPTQLSPPMSSGKARSKKEKQEPGDFSGSKKSPMSKNDPQLKQGPPHNTKLSRSPGRNNQRRSRRKTTVTSADLTHLPFKDGKGLPSIVQTPQDLSKAIVPDVAFVPQEKLEPLDLSRNKEITSPVSLESTIHIDFPSKEKEHLQLINYSSKALADGRIASASSALESTALPVLCNMAVPNNVKPVKTNKKKRSPAVPGVEGKVKPFPATVEKPLENLQDKIIKKVNEEKQAEAGVMKSEKKVKIEERISAPSSAGKKKDKDKDRKEKKEKEKDASKLKQKKKKKKKKKSKPLDYADCEVSSLDLLERSSSPLMMMNNTSAIKNISFQFPRAIISVDLTGENLSDVDFLDSSTESLILSGDEYSQEFDSTIFEESQDEEEAINEIVRCVCQMDEENGFMIQCEECLCWQHSVCMGLLEDSIPEQYVCYVCSDPPGQRWSAKYRYDRDWFNEGHLCGLSFINENYSYRNAKKIVSTHHLLADVYGVTEILHGLQLKFGILKDKDHPDLRLCAYPIKQRESGQVNHNKRSSLSSSNEKTTCGLNHKAANSLDMTDETYITSEHSYQKPQGSDEEGEASSETRKLDQKANMLLEGRKSSLRAEAKKMPAGEKRNDKVRVEQACTDRRAEEQRDSHLQRQLNLLSHIESVQNEVTSRMDVIEKEVDVLESWLDFAGDLEPPDPLARLPQLKRRIRQLLTDMGKVQQIATLCTV